MIIFGIPVLIVLIVSAWKSCKEVDEENRREAARKEKKRQKQEAKKRCTGAF